jgi:hypothetical protein
MLTGKESASTAHAAYAYCGRVECRTRSPVDSRPFSGPGTAAVTLCLTELGKDRESADQIDDGDQGEGQHPVRFKPIDDRDHAGRHEADDERVKPFHLGPVIRASRRAAAQARQARSACSRH